MPLKPKNKVSILKYKTLFEENELVIVESEEGAADLAYHLNYFKKKLNKKIVNQDKRFKNLFFDDIEEVDNSLEVARKDAKEESKLSQPKISRPAWAKKLYKKIVFITHPDKLDTIKIDFLKKRMEKLYLLAVDSYNACNYQNLLMICYDLDIAFDEKLIEAHIGSRIKKLESEVSTIKKTLGYQWYHVSESDKSHALEQYLIKLGFVFTKDDVEQAIKKAREKNKRKVGIKPVNRRRMKLK